MRKYEFCHWLVKLFAASFLCDNNELNKKKKKIGKQKRKNHHVIVNADCFGYKFQVDLSSATINLNFACKRTEKVIVKRNNFNTLKISPIHIFSPKSLVAKIYWTLINLIWAKSDHYSTNFLYSQDLNMRYYLRKTSVETLESTKC